MEPSRDPESELKVLRERVVQLERAMSTRSDPLLAALLQNAAAFLTVITPEGRLMATGRESEGFGSVVGRSVLEFTPPGSHDTVMQALAKVNETLQPVTYEAAGYGENGEPDHVYQVRAVPIVAEGRVESIVVVPTDITERVRLERSLRESNESLRLAVAASGMGFWRWDVAGDVIYWDPRLCEIYGVEQAPPDYRRYVELIHPEDLPIVEAAVRRALEQGTYPTTEHRIIRASDGAERWFLAAATVGRDEGGRPVLLHGGGLDITDRKQLARQLELAERVQAVGQLAAGIAHNFNNLLAVIVPTLSLAVEEPTPEDTSALRAALTAALQARELVQSMFALTAAPDALAGGSADASDVVKRTVAMCRATFPREIDISCSIEPAPAPVGVEASSLEQIVLHLLTNARDAIEAQPRGVAEIRVMVGYPRENAAGVARITIADSGVGMNDETRSRIFDPFFTTKARQRGTGLGLATVAARVRDARGTIECRSEPARGTTFSLELPLRSSSPSPQAEQRAPMPARLSGRVLVVDDEDLVRATLRRILKRAGLEVLEAASAPEARALLEQTPVDLVVLDDSMPYESGLAAVPSLRARTHAPFVLFTGHAPAVPDGVAALVRKPARPDELLRVVHDLLAKAKSREPS
ncbi:MAG TPA: ATP-binding protein [Polyangiaceae bacterium]|nr:ATP-binding protein [Polyangiaceae bacterium]